MDVKILIVPIPILMNISKTPSAVVLSEQTSQEMGGFHSLQKSRMGCWVLNINCIDVDNSNIKHFCLKAEGLQDLACEVSLKMAAVLLSVPAGKWAFSKH